MKKIIPVSLLLTEESSMRDIVSTYIMKNFYKNTE